MPNDRETLRELADYHGRRAHFHDNKARREPVIALANADLQKAIWHGEAQSLLTDLAGERVNHAPES